MTIIKMKRMGIVILLKFSMPLFTPLYTMAAQRPRNMVMQASGIHGEATNSENIPVTSSELPAVNWKAQDLAR